MLGKAYLANFLYFNRFGSNPMHPDLDRVPLRAFAVQTRFRAHLDPKPETQ